MPRPAGSRTRRPFSNMAPLLRSRDETIRGCAPPLASVPKGADATCRTAQNRRTFRNESCRPRQGAHHRALVVESHLEFGEPFLQVRLGKLRLLPQWLQKRQIIDRRPPDLKRAARAHEPGQSLLGYEPRTLTKLQTPARWATALATLGSDMWPSQSTKKKYSQALRLLGRDSILVMFNL